MPSRHLKKLGAGPRLPLCSTPPPPSPFKRNQRPVSELLGEECCPIIVWRRILAAQQSCVFFVVLFLFHDVPNVLDWRKPGQLSTWTLLLQSQAIVTEAAWGPFQAFPEKRPHLNGTICCSKTCTHLSALMRRPKLLTLPCCTIRDAGFWIECW